MILEKFNVEVGENSIHIIHGLKIKPKKRLKFDDDSSSQKDETAKKEEVDNTKLSQTLENSNTTNNDMISLGNLESAEKSQKASIITDEEDSYDLQKELEAKFDELFGPIDEE